MLSHCPHGYGVLLHEVVWAGLNLNVGDKLTILPKAVAVANSGLLYL